MEGDLRIVLVAFVIDIVIFGICFIAFLYLRKIRGDSTSKGVPTLPVVRAPHRRRHNNILRKIYSDPQICRRVKTADDECYDKDNIEQTGGVNHEHNNICQQRPHHQASYQQQRKGNLHIANIDDQEASHNILHRMSSSSNRDISSSSSHPIPLRSLTSPPNVLDQNTCHSARKIITENTPTTSSQLYQFRKHSIAGTHQRRKSQQQLEGTTIETPATLFMGGGANRTLAGGHLYLYPHSTSSSPGFCRDIKDGLDDMEPNNSSETDQPTDDGGGGNEEIHTHDSMHNGTEAANNLSIIPCQQNGKHGITPYRPHSYYESRHNNENNQNVFTRLYSMFSWVRELLLMDDTGFQSTDAQFYLLFLKQCQRITFWLSLLALAVILPVNLTASVKSDEQGWLDWASAVNILWNDWRVWSILGCTWIYSIITYYYIYHFGLVISDPIYLSSPIGFNPEAFTIMVRDIPKTTTNPNILKNHFNKLFPHNVVYVSLIRDHAKLFIAKKDLEEAIEKLQKALKLTQNQVDGAQLADVLCLPVEEQQQFHHGNPPVIPIYIDDEFIQQPYMAAPNDIATVTTIDAKAAFDFTPAAFSPILAPASPETNNGAQQPSQISEWLIILKQNICCCCCCGDCSDCTRKKTPESEILYWSNEASRRSCIVAQLMDAEPKKMAGMAFVSFRSTYCVANSLNDPRAVGNNYQWFLSPAPPPQDILWDNTHISIINRVFKGIVLNFLVFIASVILTSSAMATNALLPLADSLEKAFREVNFLKLSITGWGGPLLLFLINSLLLPYIVQWAAYGTQYWRLSHRESAILHGNVVFLFLNTVIFPVLGNGSIGALLERMYDTEIQEWNISIGRLVVGQSGSFALRYLLNGCFLSSAAQLLQIAQILYFGILQTFGQQGESWQFDFGYHYAFALSIFFLMLSFGVVIPLVLPLSCLFFTSKYLVDKYNFMFGVWKVDHETGGAVASIALRYMVGAVAFFQFVMSGYFITYGMKAVSSVEEDANIGLSHGTVALGRCLVLGGTFVFLFSLVTVILLWGRSMGMLRLPHEPVKQTSTAVTELPPEKEEQLSRAYIHPYESEIARRMSWRAQCQQSYHV